MKVDYPAMYSDTEPMFNCYQVSACDMQYGDNLLANLPLDISQVSNTIHCFNLREVCHKLHIYLVRIYI